RRGPKRWPSDASLCLRGSGVEILFCQLVVAQLSDIDPIVVHQVFAHGVMLGDHALDEAVDAEISRTRNQAQDLGPHHVDPGQYLLQIIRLLLDFGDEIAFGDHAPETERNGDFLRHHRQPGPLRQGKSAELAEIDIGENISVHHEKRLLEVLSQESQWAAGPKRLFFLADDHAHAAFLAAPDDASEIIRHVIRRDYDLLTPVLPERENLNFKHRALADRQQWLGNDVREWTKAQPQPTRKDDRQLDRHLSSPGCASKWRA